MKNTQLYLSIGIPTLTVILAWLANRSDMNRLSDKLDSSVLTLNERIDKLIESHHKDNLAPHGLHGPAPRTHGK